MKKQLAVLFFSLLVTGCGDRFSRDHSKDGFTTIAFSNSITKPLNLAEDFNAFELLQNSMTFPIMTRGAIIYAVDASSSGSKFKSIVVTDHTAITAASMTLPNATYKFYVIGYQNGGAGFVDGAPICVRAVLGGVAGAAITLNSTPTTVNFDSAIGGNSGSCIDPPFGDGLNNLTAFSINVCDAAADFSAPAPASLSDSCSNFGGGGNLSGGAKIFYYSQDETTPTGVTPSPAGPNLVTTCLGATGGDAGSISLGTFIPVVGFTNNEPIRIDVQFYDNGVCGTLQKRFTFMSPMANAQATPVFKDGSAALTSAGFFRAGAAGALYLAN